MFNLVNIHETHAVKQTNCLASLTGIVNGNLCHGCGTCIGLCPAGILGVTGGSNRPVPLKNGCNDCGTCVNVCPGARFDDPECGRRLWGSDEERADPVGRVIEGWLGHAGAPSIRRRGASGGAVTALLLSLMSEGRIDGAVVVGQDAKERWRSKALLARSAEEIVSAANSRYAIAPTGAVISEIVNTPGRFAFVGLPCQLHGFHNACKVNRKLAERVALVIGLFCHASVEPEAFHLLWEWTVADGTKVESLDYRRGKPAGDLMLNFTDGSSRPFLFPAKSGYRPNIIELMNVLYRLYSQPRCMTCYDATALFADISVGDPWGIPAPDGIDYEKGFSCILARTTAGHSAVDRAIETQALSCTPLSRHQMRLANRDMARAKERRAFRLIGRLQNKGRRTPEYGLNAQSFTPWQKWGADMDLLFRSFSLHRFGRRLMLRMMLSPAGYWIFRLNHWRRRIMPWLRKCTPRSVSRMNRKAMMGVALPQYLEPEIWQEALFTVTSLC